MLVRTLLVILIFSKFFEFSSDSRAENLIYSSIDSRIIGHRLSYYMFIPDVERGSITRIVYLLHGYQGHATDWIHLGHAGETINRLIISGHIDPMLIIMPDADNSWYVGSYETAIIRELLPEIDRNFHVEHPERAIAGLSMGGFGALHLAMNHPEMFIASASLSGAIWQNPGPMLGGINRDTLFAGAFGRPFDPALWFNASPFHLLQVGIGNRMPSILLVAAPDDPFHVQQPAQELCHNIMRQGGRVRFLSRGHGHSWAEWSAELENVLIFFNQNFRGERMESHCE